MIKKWSNGSLCQDQAGDCSACRSGYMQADCELLLSKTPAAFSLGHSEFVAGPGLVGNS